MSDLMLSTVFIWIFRVVAAIALAALAAALLVSVLLVLNLWIFHVPLSTR